MENSLHNSLRASDNNTWVRTCDTPATIVTGDRVDSIDFWSARVRDLEQRITIAREAALEHAPTTSYFVFFNNQKDAAIAAQTNLHAEDGHSFRVMEAPGPEEVGFAGISQAVKKK